jgi:hypothetical protein
MIYSLFYRHLTRRMKLLALPKAVPVIKELISNFFILSLLTTLRRHNISEMNGNRAEEASPVYIQPMINPLSITGVSLSASHLMSQVEAQYIAQHVTPVRYF